MQIASLRNLQQKQQQLKPPTNPPSTKEIQQDDAWDPNLIEADDDYDIYNNNNKNTQIDTDDVFKNYYYGNDELSMLHIIGLVILIIGLFVIKRKFGSGDTGRWRDTIPNRRRSAMF